MKNRDFTRKTPEQYKAIFYNKSYPEPNTGCWLWCGFYDDDGYGVMSHRTGFKTAHRYSYFIHNGDFDRKLNVLHKCDNPCCVNPDHLFLGTQTDNNMDKVKKGRAAKGERHGMRLITRQDVYNIYNTYIKGIYSQRDLSKLTKVKYSVIGNILRGRTWRHLNLNWDLFDAVRKTRSEGGWKWNRL
jgi:hypothetical protein